MASASPIDRLAQAIAQELQVSSANIADKLRPEIVSPVDVQSKEDFLNYVDRHWDDEDFRANLHQQYGDSHFINIANDVLNRRTAQNTLANQPPTVGAAAQKAGQIQSLMPPATPTPPMAPSPALPMPPAPPAPVAPPGGIAGLPPGVSVPGMPQ